MLPLLLLWGEPAQCQPHPHHHPDDPHTAAAREGDDPAAAAAAAATAASAAAAAASAAASAVTTAAAATGAMPSGAGSEIHVDHEGGFCKPCAQAWRALRAAWRGESPGQAAVAAASSGEAVKAEAVAGAAAAATALPEQFVASAPVAASAAGAVMGTAAGSAAAAAAGKVGSWTHHAVAASAALLKFNCGLIGGITQAGLFNPWDRALYLSVKESRPFLAWDNFSRPYQGFGQAILQASMLFWGGSCCVVVCCVVLCSDAGRRVVSIHPTHP